VRLEARLYGFVYLEELTRTKDIIQSLGEGSPWSGGRHPQDMGVRPSP
jgi:hypothetical protein